jgi:hypothetical protein
MRQWLRRIRGAFMVGLTWAIAWGLGGGAVMEVIVDPDGRIADIWPIAERRRRFDELSLPRFGAWGAAAGAGLGLLGVALFGLGGLIVLPLALLGAVSACGSLALARKGEDRERLGTGKDLETRG